VELPKNRGRSQTAATEKMTFAEISDEVEARAMNQKIPKIWAGQRQKTGLGKIFVLPKSLGKYLQVGSWGNLSSFNAI
jgi:hypothetical protein